MGGCILCHSLVTQGTVTSFFIDKSMLFNWSASVRQVTWSSVIHEIGSMFHITQQSWWNGETPKSLLQEILPCSNTSLSFVMWCGVYILVSNRGSFLSVVLHMIVFLSCAWNFGVDAVCRRGVEGRSSSCSTRQQTTVWIWRSRTDGP